MLIRLVTDYQMYTHPAVSGCPHAPPVAVYLPPQNKLMWSLIDAIKTVLIFFFSLMLSMINL